MNASRGYRGIRQPGGNIPGRRTTLCLRPQPLPGEESGPGLSGKEPAGLQPAPAFPAAISNPWTSALGKGGKNPSFNFKSAVASRFRDGRFDERRGFKRSEHQNQQPGGCRHVLLRRLTNASSLPRAVGQTFPSTTTHGPVAFTVCFPHE